MEPLPFPLSSRAKPRDLRFRGPILEMFFNRAQRSREISGFFSVLTHPLYPNSLSILYCPTKEAAEKPEFFEGDGLQAVHNCFVVSAALAAEGAVFLQPGLLPQPLKSLP